MLIKDVITLLENTFPLSTQASFDNSGIQVGNVELVLNKILISLDCTEEVVNEAIQSGANLIISHHPIFFKGIKNLTGKNYVERTLLKAIKHDITLYAIHTNLDHHPKGVNYKIASLLGLKNLSFLTHDIEKIYKLAVFVPEKNKSELENALFSAGAGAIGNYSECSFVSSGIGSFKANDSANPFIGNKNERHFESEFKLEVIFGKSQLNSVLNAMFTNHPYEEVAYDLIELANENKSYGSGMIGNLETSIDTIELLKKIKDTFKYGTIKHTKVIKKDIIRIAICGGSGSFLLQDAIKQKADVYISADFKYHEYFDAEDKIMIMDIGHYESEQFTSNLLAEFLSKHIDAGLVSISKINTNPISYF